MTFRTLALLNLLSYAAEEGNYHLSLQFQANALQIPGKIIHLPRSKILHSIYLSRRKVYMGSPSPYPLTVPSGRLSNLSRIVCEYSQPSLAFSGTTLFSPFSLMKRHQWQGETRGGCLCWLVAKGGKKTELSAHLGVNQHRPIFLGDFVSHLLYYVYHPIL